MKPLFRLLPLLVIYVLLLVMTDLPETGRTDGARYLWFAENLSAGFYSPTDNVNLWAVLAIPSCLCPLSDWAHP